jgi:two-component sensor histidine kinase
VIGGDEVGRILPFDGRNAGRYRSPRSFEDEIEARVQARTGELRAALADHRVRLREVHHRVKNNLQILSSLISMQLRSLSDGAERAALEECQTRVQAIAMVHEQLGAENDASVPFSQYARSLAESVFAATGLSPSQVSLALSIEDGVVLAVGKAVPCGLVLNELVTNAARHAFRDGRRGTIHVELERVAQSGLRLVVADDGAGIELGTRTRLGLRLVRMLAEQLDARLEVESGRGTCFRLTLAEA